MFSNIGTRDTEIGSLFHIVRTRILIDWVSSVIYRMEDWCEGGCMVAMPTPNLLHNYNMCINVIRVVSVCILL